MDLVVIVLFYLKFLGNIPMAIYKYDDFISELKKIIGDKIIKQSPGTALDVDLVDNASNIFTTTGDIDSRVAETIKYSGPIAPPVLKIIKVNNRTPFAYLTKYTPRELPKAFPHTGTQWQISLNNTFTSILYDVILEHKEDLYSLYPFIYVSGTFYVRARFVSNGFCSHWSNIGKYTVSGYDYKPDTNSQPKDIYDIKTTIYGYKISINNLYTNTDKEANTCYTEMELYDDEGNLIKRENSEISYVPTQTRPHISMKVYNYEIPYVGDYVLYHRVVFGDTKTLWRKTKIYFDKNEVRTVTIMPADVTKNHARLSTTSKSVIITSGVYADGVGTSSGKTYMRLYVDGHKNNSDINPGTNKQTLTIPAPTDIGGQIAISGHVMLKEHHTDTSEVHQATNTSLFYGGYNTTNSTYSNKMYTINELGAIGAGVQSGTFPVVHGYGLYKRRYVGTNSEQTDVFYNGGEYSSVSKVYNNYARDISNTNVVQLFNTNRVYKYKGSCASYGGLGYIITGGIELNRFYGGANEEQITDQTYSVSIMDNNRDINLGNTEMITTKKAQLPYPLYYHGSVVVDGELFLIGGNSTMFSNYDSVGGKFKRQYPGYRSEIVRFDPYTGKYNIVGYLQQAMGPIHAESYKDGRVFLFGGPTPSAQKERNNVMLIG